MGTPRSEHVLLDAERDEALHAEGYTTVPFLLPDEVQDLRDRYAALVPDTDDGLMAIDYTRDDRRVMEGVTELVDPVVRRHVPEHFVDHEAVFVTFVTKPAHPFSEMFLHDDRTWIDDDARRTCTIWVPLVDTSPERANGCLHVVPRSHEIMAAASGTNTPRWMDPYDDYLRRHARPLTLPAGSAVIYDTRTLHFSPPNLSNEPRPAIAATVVPTGAPLVHVHARGMHQRTVYGVDRRFFVDFHPLALEMGMPPGYPVVREYREQQVDADPAAVARIGPPGDLPVPVGTVTEPVPRVYPSPDDGAEGNGDDGYSPEVVVPAAPASRWTQSPGLAARLTGLWRRR